MRHIFAVSVKKRNDVNFLIIISVILLYFSITTATITKVSFENIPELFNKHVIIIYLKLIQILLGNFQIII